jgi:hypothetical protein
MAGSVMSNVTSHSMGGFLADDRFLADLSDADLQATIDLRNRDYARIWLASELAQSRLDAAFCEQRRRQFLGAA